VFKKNREKKERMGERYTLSKYLKKKRSLASISCAQIGHKIKPQALFCYTKEAKCI
jgi:HEAT repeat protein